MDFLEHILGPNEFINSKDLQTRLGIPPANFIELINIHNIKYYVDILGVLSDETAEFSADRIEHFMPVKAPLELSQLGDFKFHEYDIRAAAKNVEVLQPLLQAYSGSSNCDDERTRDQLLEEIARLAEALKASARGEFEANNLQEGSELIAWEKAIAEADVSPPVRTRLTVWLKRKKRMKVVELEAEYPGRNIERDVRDAQKKDVPALMLKFPSLPPIGG